MAAAEIIAEAQKHVLHGTGKERELLWRTSLRTSLAAGWCFFCDESESVRAVALPTRRQSVCEALCQSTCARNALLCAAAAKRELQPRAPAI